MINKRHFIFAFYLLSLLGVTIFHAEDISRQALGHPFKKKILERKQLKKAHANKNNRPKNITLAYEPSQPKPFALSLPSDNDDQSQLEEKHTRYDDPTGFKPIEIEPKAVIAPYAIQPVESLTPKTATNDPQDTIEVNFEKVDLLNFLKWIESIFNITFLTGDLFTPSPKDMGKVTGNLISYRTNKALTKRQVWDLFLKFLHLFNLAPVINSYKDNYPDSFVILPSDVSNRSALPSFVGVPWTTLPNNDTKIRYVYFAENSQVRTLYNVILDFISKNAALHVYEPLNALIITDIASNVRSLMAIVSQLDNVSMPEALSVLKLKNANAKDVEDLYNALVKTESRDGTITSRLFGPQRKVPSAIYFPPDTKVIAERRTNALIILGTREGIEKVEDFIINHIDTELKQPYSPLYVYDLQYASSDSIVSILEKVTRYDPDSDAAKFGGVREGDKFLRPMTFISEPSGNRILIKAEKEDYLKVRDIIKRLDVKQPQVEIEVLIVSISADKSKELGTQIRNKRVDTVSKNISFQTSGLQNGDPNAVVGGNVGIIPDQNGGLMGNLVQLAQGQLPGTTLVSIGSSMVGGVWALFKALETYLYTNVISHPFLTTTNKYTAIVSLGETRRVQTGTVQGSGSGTQTLGDATANLKVKITPQINSIGIIILDIDIAIEEFSDTDPSSANKSSREVKTKSSVANGEILAIGGLVRTENTTIVSKVPILGDIPVLGWFFKDKSETRTKDSLLLFICPRIVEPMQAPGMSKYTLNKACKAKATLACECNYPEERDPIHRWFFDHTVQKDMEIIDNYLTHKDPCTDEGENWWGTDIGGCICPAPCPTCEELYNCTFGNTRMPFPAKEVYPRPEPISCTPCQPEPVPCAPCQPCAQQDKPTQRKSMIDFIPPEEPLEGKTC